MSLVAGTRRSFEAGDAGRLRTGSRYGGGRRLLPQGDSTRSGGTADIRQTLLLADGEGSAHRARMHVAEVRVRARGEAERPRSSHCERHSGSLVDPRALEVEVVVGGAVANDDRPIAGRQMVDQRSVGPLQRDGRPGPNTCVQARGGDRGHEQGDADRRDERKSQVHAPSTTRRRERIAGPARPCAGPARDRGR